MYLSLIHNLDYWLSESENVRQIWQCNMKKANIHSFVAPLFVVLLQFAYFGALEN